MASGLLNESGQWNPDAIERQLAHVEGNDVRRAYARAQFWQERVAMMQWWADYVDDMRRADARLARTWPSFPAATESRRSPEEDEEDDASPPRAPESVVVWNVGPGEGADPVA